MHTRCLSAESNIQILQLETEVCAKVRPTLGFMFVKISKYIETM